MEQDPINVLIVEDNPGDARLIQEELRDAAGHFLAEHVESLGDALDRLTTTDFDVALLDLSLPDSKGLRTVEKLQAVAAGLPVIVLTGLEDEELAMQAVRAGAQDYLVKGSVDGRTLSRAMRYAIERQEAARELTQLRKELAMTEKLSTLGALVSGLASELRTSTTFITNTLFQIRQRMEQAVADDPALTDLGAEVGDRMVQAMEGIDRIDRLVRDLRGFTRRGDEPDLEQGLEHAVSEAVDVFRTTHRSRVNVEAAIEPTAPMPLRPIQVQQVVLNLLANASDAMPDGGTVRVTVRPATNGAELVVEDEGHGVPPTATTKLFDPFFTTRPGATGMGLAIARRIVAAHGGRIDVESTPGRGARFTVFFPQRGGTTRAPSVAEA